MSDQEKSAWVRELAPVASPRSLMFHVTEHKKGSHGLAELIRQEAFARVVSRVQSPLFHIWQRPATVLLGGRERALPFLQKGMDHLRAVGYETVVRPFGGLAVPLDRGVLNLTYMTPRDVPIETAFRAMAELLCELLSPLSIEVGEVPQAYCPGRYDLHIGGVKVAGLAQRRLRGVVQVSAALNVTPASVSRAALIRSFYQHATTGREAWVPHVSDDAVGDLLSFGCAAASSSERMIAHIKHGLARYWTLRAVIEPTHDEQEDALRRLSP